MTLSLIAGATVIVIVGICDDICNIRPRYKLLGQIAAATIIIFYGNIFFEFNAPLYLEIILTYFWILGVTNAVNLIDGMDGLASGLALIGFVALGVAASLQGNVYFATLCFVMVGSILGFLRFNLPPAVIFMGDTGSLFLGFTISVLSLIISYKSGTVLSVLVPVMFISIPVFDTFLAIIRRLSKGEHPFSADKEHLHHRLLELHFTTKQTLLTFYSLSALLGAVAVIFNNKEIKYGLIIAFILIYVFLIILKISHLFNLNQIVIRVNDKIKYIKRITAENKTDSKPIICVNYLISALTYLFLIAVAANKTSWNYAEIIAILIFACVISISIWLSKILKIKNEFINFLIFWFLYYINLFIVSNSLAKDFFIVYCLLVLLLSLKLILKKRVDFLFISPMEILAIYGLFMINLMSNISITNNVLTLFLTTIMYYPNKAILTSRYKYYRYHIAFMLIILISMPYGFYYSFYKEMTDSYKINYTKYVSPISYKKTADEYIDQGKYKKARDVILEYHKKARLPIIQKIVYGKTNKIYANLIINELTKGNLNKSNKYLEEYLKMHPETISELYNQIKPFFKQISQLKIERPEDIKVSGIPLNKIFSKYSETIKKAGLKQIQKGYASQGRECLKVATTINGFLR
ncbi:MraY family glycosyltransferase [Flexistipes sp.]|uniref:MraY family glycosyltransferase n=1 Tax=Flexistipes sp. TaxID=3088135 RepID=UPI002E22F1D7|nr:MraY family glycosyltransferase [Flexistipes sp.]